MKPLSIIGGGLAGLTLGIGLRRQGAPVTVLEAGHYPRHRVCGEFINGRGLTVLENLGLTGDLKLAGARPIHTVAFILKQNATLPLNLPAPGLAISRYKLDDLLAHRFREMGGDLRCGSRHPMGAWTEGLVRASGRIIQKDPAGTRWIGMKAHAQQATLAADLEIHVNLNEYIGLVQLEVDRVNVCGLFRSPGPSPNLARERSARLRGQPGSLLNERLRKDAFIDDTFCAVAGLGWQDLAPAGPDECAIGDALGMIPPITGNGMSIAIESAAIAAWPLIQYSRGRLSWNDACGQVALACKQHFRLRLKWATWLQRLLMTGAGSRSLYLIVTRIPGIWPLLFKTTR